MFRETARLLTLVPDCIGAVTQRRSFYSAFAPVSKSPWIPACAGMTYAELLLACDSIIRGWDS